MECKVVLGRIVAKGVADLIETLWNVKEGSTTGDAELSGFNRDIVECKVSSQFNFHPVHLRFNRDIVECKVKA